MAPPVPMAICIGVVYGVVLVNIKMLYVQQIHLQINLQVVLTHNFDLQLDLQIVLTKQFDVQNRKLCCISNSVHKLNLQIIFIF